MKNLQSPLTNSCLINIISNSRYFSPGYPDTILAIVDTYKPKLPTGNSNQVGSSSEKSMSMLSLNDEKYWSMIQKTMHNKNEMWEIGNE